MRTITRLCLVASIATAVGLAGVPAAGAAERSGGALKIKGISSLNETEQDRAIRKARRRINRLKEWNFTLQNWNKSQQASIDTILANVPTITGALTALQSGLLALQAALEGPVAEGFEEIEDALNDSTTGLVGLNLARPQFGAFLPPGTFQGGTGPVNGADPPHGPDGAAATGSGIGAPSTYVVDFNNDVSTRMYSVNVFPGSAAGATPVGAAVNCALAASTCNAISAGTGNTSHVLVKIGTGAQAVDGTSFGGFSVTALSG